MVLYNIHIVNRVKDIFLSTHVVSTRGLGEALQARKTARRRRVGQRTAPRIKGRALMTARTGIASGMAKIAIPERSLGEARTQRSGDERLKPALAL